METVEGIKAALSLLLKNEYLMSDPGSPLLSFIWNECGLVWCRVLATGLGHLSV